MKLDRSKPFGTICGTHDPFPNARFEQGGRFFGVDGNLCPGQNVPKAEAPAPKVDPATDAAAKAQKAADAAAAKTAKAAAAKAQKAKDAETQAAKEANDGAGEGAGEGGEDF